MEKIYYLNPTTTNENRHKTYILDSNIVIGLSRLYYGRYSNEDDVNGHNELFQSLKEEDVIPGIGIQELSWNYEINKQNHELRNQLVNAMNGLFKNSIDRDRKHLNIGSMNFNGLYSNREVNELMLMSNCLLKKFAILYSSGMSNEKIFYGLIDFINKEHKMLLSYEFILITNFLFSKNQTYSTMLKKLFKINSKTISDKQIYNGNWDLFFLRLVHDLTLRAFDGKAISNIYNVCLITKDKALYDIGTSLFNNHENTNVSVGNRTAFGIFLDTDGIRNGDWEIVENGYRLLCENESDRISFLQNNDLINHYTNLLKTLDDLR
ncbi:TPA: hypothetical protein KOQ79_003512 [Clostridioides difficile]|nr:hypothetical protein [Clostridioides difficile]HBF5457514.1 hypothetical protein [Clostridioides difficile]